MLFDKLVAYALWFFFDYFGFHRFWYKKFLSGIIQFSLIFLPFLFFFFGIAGVTLGAIFESPFGYFNFWGIHYSRSFEYFGGVLHGGGLMPFSFYSGRIGIIPIEGIWIKSSLYFYQ